jgi:hypothetical protein
MGFLRHIWRVLCHRFFVNRAAESACREQDGQLCFRGDSELTPKTGEAPLDATETRIRPLGDLLRGKALRDQS